MDQHELRPHVIIFPLPLQAPVNSMLKLAELLCLADLQITFLLTDHIYGRLERYSNIQTRFQHYPGFSIRTISDGLQEEHPRGDRFLEVFESLRSNSKALFKEMLCSLRVSCVIANGILGFTCDVANEVGVPIFYVRTISAACLWVFFCLPKLIEAGELPFEGERVPVVFLCVSVPFAVFLLMFYPRLADYFLIKEDVMFLVYVDTPANIYNANSIALHA